LPFLHLAAIAVDLVNTEIGVGAIAQAHRGRRPTDFFHRDDVREVAHGTATIDLGHGDTEQPHIAELAPQRVGEFIAAIDFSRERRDFGLRKIVHRGAQQIDGFAEFKIQRGNVYHFPAPVDVCCLPLAARISRSD